jgi:hypothetical protein
LVCALSRITGNHHYRYRIQFQLPVNPSIIMAAVWDPRNLLEVDPMGVAPCVGTTQK